jgi:hypothetical protein
MGIMIKFMEFTTRRKDLAICERDYNFILFSCPRWFNLNLSGALRES